MLHGVVRRHVQRARLAASAQSGRGAQRHRGGVLLLGDVKHVFVVDDDIDVFSDEQIDWALATRFQADRDFVVASGFRCVPLDPSLQGSRTGAKAGFDCTKPFGKGDSFEFTMPIAAELPQRARRSVEEALAEGPATYLDLMAALGTRDGREVIRALRQALCRKAASGGSRTGATRSTADERNGVCFSTHVVEDARQIGGVVGGRCACDQLREGRAVDEPATDRQFPRDKRRAVRSGPGSP